MTEPKIDSRWHRFINRLCCRAFFDRVTVLHPERLPSPDEEPVLFLSLHRNGAVDGFVLRTVLSGATFLISRHLVRSPFLRTFFSGIPVARSTDGTSAERARHGFNDRALERSVDHLACGGRLIIFPEGTSDLGPRHQPFRSGAARVIRRFRERHPGSPLHVVPVGLHYERGWAFRSRVEVVVGHPIAPPTATGSGPLGETRDRIRRRLEEVGANFGSAGEQELAERLAHAATLGTRIPFFEALKRFEAGGVPASVIDRWCAFDAAANRAGGILRHQGVPLFPASRRSLPLYAAGLAAIAPLVAAAAAGNAPVLAAAWAAGRFGADGRNVVALWRLLVGLPASALWVLLLAGVSLHAGQTAWFAAWAAISLGGLLFHHRFMKLAVSVHNAVRFPHLHPRALEFHRHLIHHLESEDDDDEHDLPGARAAMAR